MNLNVPDILLTDNPDELSQLIGVQESSVVLLFCHGGKMRLSVDGKDHQLEQNDLLVCAHASFVGNYMRTPDFGCVIICMRGRFFEQVAVECFRGEPRWLEKQSYIKAHPVLHLHESQCLLMRSYASLISAHLQGAQDGYRHLICRHLAQAATLEMLSFLDKAIEEGAADDHSKGSTKADLLMLRFVELLHHCAQEHHDVNWFAAQLCVTPKYLSRVCKQRSGRTALQWIDEVTVEELKRLLLRTDVSIKEAAFACGFSNVSFFCQYVKHHTGKTPSQLRRSRE